MFFSFCRDPAKNRNRPFKDSDAKWQHDLYMDYEDEPTSSQFQNYRGQEPRRGRGRPGRGGGGGGSNRNQNRDRDQLQIDDYIPPSQRGRGAGRGTGRRPQQQEQQNEEGMDRRRRPQNMDKPRNDRTNTFDVEDYTRPTSSSFNNRGRGNRNNYGDNQGPPRRQRREFEQYQTDDQPTPPRRNQQQQQQASGDQSWHRERNFTNTQFQQQRSGPRNENFNRDDQKWTGGQGNEEDNRGQNRPQRRDNNEPLRRQGPNNRNQPTDSGPSNFSVEASNLERSKRYSNMRSTTSTSAPPPPQQQSQPQPQRQQQQQQPPQQQIPIQSYQEPRQNYFNQRT